MACGPITIRSPPYPSTGLQTSSSSRPEHLGPLLRDPAQVRRHVREQRLLAQVVLDQLGHVGVHRLVVADAVAQRVGQRDGVRVQRRRPGSGPSGMPSAPGECTRLSSSIRR